jgi:Cellulase (glycosyl hydrolase family 5)
MTKINNKNIYRTILISTFILVNIALLFGLAKILDYLNSGAERTTMLHLERQTVNTYLPKVIWESLDNPGRKMEEQTLARIENDYLFSWHIKNSALKTNTKEGIDDFYTDSTRVNLYRIIENNSKQKITVESTTIEHHPSLDFYSADGQLVVFTDRNVVAYQNVFQDEQLVSQIKDTATYKVMMLLEDGFWRIRHMKRMPKEQINYGTVNTDTLYKVMGKHIYKNGSKFTIKGINYYPKNSAWDMFGAKFNIDTIASDFDIIKSTPLNTIRIFVPYQDFGEADVNKEKLERLKQVMDLAGEKKLAVIVTLFDFYGDYSVQNWTLTHRHAEKVVMALKDSPALLAWDVKNEPDLDFKSRGKENVMAWLQNIVPLVKQWDPNHLVTIGWSNCDDAVHLEEEVDFVSFHYYQNIDHFVAKYNALDGKTQRPIVVEEFGMSSYTGFWSWFGNNEQDQAVYHKQMQAWFKENGLAFVSWTLYDFPAVPVKVVGKKPWNRNKQKEFGFIDEKNKRKPSFSYISY